MRRPVIIAAMLVIFAACGDRSSNLELAAKAVDKFHAQYNERSFELICLEAAPEFKQNQQAALSYLEKVHETMGRALQSTQGTSSVQNMGDEAAITLVNITVFEQGKTAETFVYRVKNREPKLTFYEAKGPGLTKD